MGTARLLEAFDQAIAAVRLLEVAGLRTSAGAPAAGELRHLLDELVARRAAVAAGSPLDGAWTRRTVRWVAEWLPDRELALLARLGGIARAAGHAGER